jgi:uncharacterized protein YvpB
MSAFGKTIIIAMVFVLSLFALMEIKGETMSGKRLHCMVFLETNADWKRCQLDNCRILDKENSIGFINLSEPAEMITDNIYAGFSFTQLILSWNAARPDSSPSVDFIIEVSPDSKAWHRFNYQTWGGNTAADGAASSTKKIEGIGWINVDYLVLENPMRYARVIVRTPGNGESGEIILRRLSLAFSNENAEWDEYRAHHGLVKKPDYSEFKLAVPYHSQRSLPNSLAGNCCSPTSVCMVLNYHGIEVTPEEMAHKTYDQRGGIYGNWPYNAAAAYERGLSKAWVEVHCGFDEIYAEVSAGRPVVISIAFEPGELPRSPVRDGSEGHLIAVVGFDGPNTVICNDPAGHNAEDGIINYPRKELEDIWLRHGGVAYHLWPIQ